jgi:hypothetical protein
MGPEAIVGAFSQFMTVFMIIGLFIGGAIRRGRVLAIVVVTSSAALGIAVSMLAPVAVAGLFAFLVAVVAVGLFAVVGHFIRKRLDAHARDKAV